jgi:hypothetical protein
MTDPGEVEALKASMRGARRSGDHLQEIAARVEQIDAHGDIPDSDLEDLRRLTSAHAVAAQALRGLVQTILKRRGKIIDETVGGSSGGDADA